MSTNTVSSVTRAGYVAYLRRAFFLRAHPDRFRKHSNDVVKQQAVIIQSLSDRFAAPDFNSYLANNTISRQEASQGFYKEWKPQRFYLERKNGKLIQHTLHLNKTVEDVLDSLTKALESTGLKTMKPPPKVEILKENNTNYHNTELNQMHWADENTNGKKLNTAFDLNTKQGRDLIDFIKHLDTKDIEKRKADRINASAAALVARQAFKFKSIDGTGLGWSSSSLAQCLKTLTKVFDEHGALLINSFYPLQLILSNDEFHSKLDLYGGTMMLNPGSTQIQWLETLTLVTEEKLNTLELNRKQISNYLRNAENEMNVKIRKGFSCSSDEYFDFLRGISEFPFHQNVKDEIKPLTNALALDRLRIVVETPQACRRPVVTHNGEIRISSSISLGTILPSLNRLRRDATEKVILDKEKQRQMKELEIMLKNEFGLTSVKKSRYSTVSNDQYIKSLSNLLGFQGQRMELKDGLVGKSILIASPGGYCRLGDDGSLVIPSNWQ